jgi:hypothetical protein
VTNPDLLKAIRPKIYSLFEAEWKSVEVRPWREVLAAVPRQLKAAENKIFRARRVLELASRA